MPRRIDHLVICVRDLAQAELNLRTLGFTLTRLQHGTGTWPTSSGAVHQRPRDGEFNSLISATSTVPVTDSVT
jgi:hypothetical protein